MMTPMDIWQLFAWLWLLVFGMSIFEESVKSLSSHTVKKVLQRYTGNTWKSILTGTLATSLLQSSSLVSLILLGFVWAGVLHLSNAIGIIIGANIGTTASSLIVALLGFDKFSISAFALPMIAVGWLLLIFAKNKRLTFVSRLLVWFWLLFLWLDFMKDSVDALKDGFSFTHYAYGWLPLFFLVWLVVTAIIQSSSAVGVMTLAAINAWIIDFPSSAAIIIWANIGTTFTGVLASLGGRVIKRQLALFQVLFNLFSAVFWIVFFWQYIRFVNDFLWFANNHVMGNAVLNAVFKISTALLFAPFLSYFTKLVKLIVPQHNHDSLHLAIAKLDSNTFSLEETLLAPAQISALLVDSKEMVGHTISYNCRPWWFNFSDIQSSSTKDIECLVRSFDVDSHDHDYELTQQRADHLFQFISSIKKPSLAEEEIKTLDKCYNALVACVRSMKAIKNVRHNILALRDTEDKLRKELYNSLRHDNIHLYKEVASIMMEEGESDSHIQSIRTFVSNIKERYSYYASTITWLSIDEESWEVDLASLINLHRELYESVLWLSRAVQFLYLTDSQSGLSL